MMTTDARHSKATPTNIGVHVMYAFIYNNAIDRIGAVGLKVEDEGKVARQLDNNTFWVLTNYTGPTWVEVTAVQLTSNAPVNVTKSVAIVGTGVLAARDDHKHNITTALPVPIGTSLSEGTSTSLARADHIHSIDLSYPNVSIISIRGRSWGSVSLGVQTYSTDFSVVQKQNNVESKECIADGVTSPTILDCTTINWRSIGAYIGVGQSSGNTVAGRIECQSEINLQVPIGSSVKNMRTGEWGRISSYVSAKIANVTGFISGHQVWDIFEFRTYPAGTFYVYNRTRHIGQNVTGWSVVNPSRLVLTVPIAGQIPGDLCTVFLGQVLWQWDEVGFNVMISGGVVGSDPPTNSLITIFNKSKMEMQFIVRWRI